MSNLQNKKMLKADFKEFESLFDMALETKSDLELLKIIAQDIAPLIRTAEICNNANLKWTNSANLYLKEKHQLNSNVSTEVEQGFLSLKFVLEEKKFFNNPIIMCKVYDVERLFQQKEEPLDGGYSYIDLACVQIRSLLGTLLDIGVDDIVKKYAKIKLCDIPMVNVHTGKWQMVSKTVSELIFAPSIVKKNELENLFCKYSKVEDSWVAREILLYVEWCWNTEPSFFEGDLDKNKLALRNIWIELEDVKKNNGTDNISLAFFRRDRLIDSLKLIHDEIMPGNLVKNKLDKIKPYKLELRLYKAHMIDHLLLDIYWDILGGCDTRKIHSFRTKSIGFNLINEILSKPCGTLLDIRKFGGQSVAAIFTKLKLQNILGDIFFDKPDTGKTHRVFMKFKSVKIEDISKIDANRLVNHINKLERFIPIY